MSDYVEGGAGSAFVANVQIFVDILDAGLASASSGSFEIPMTGNVGFSGSSIITDLIIPDTVDTAEEAAGYLIVTGSADVTVNLGVGTVTVTMKDFIDVEDNPVSGSVSGAGTFTPGLQGFFGTVSGNVAATGISAEQGGIIFGNASSADGVFGSFFGDGPNGGVIGSGGPFAGDEIAGAYAAD